MLTILFASAIRILRSSFVPFCARLTRLLDVHVRDASEYLGEVGSAEILGRLTLGGLAFSAGALLGLVEDDPGGLLPRPPLFLLDALALLFAAPLFLVEKLLTQLEEAAPAVGGQAGVLDESVDQSRLSEQPDLVDDQRFLGRPRHESGEPQQRVVRDGPAPDDPFEDHVVVDVPADDLELLLGRIRLVEEAGDVVGRRAKQRLDGGRADVRRPRPRRPRAGRGDGPRSRAAAGRGPRTSAARARRPASGGSGEGPGGRRPSGARVRPRDGDRDAR